MKKKIGVLAGTFDPIHTGHIALADAARQKAKLDKVILLVERQPRRKEAKATYSQRQAMCQLVAANKEWLEVLEFKDLHFDVHQTLPQLQKHFPKAELAMILGSDVFSHLPTWAELDSLVEKVRFIVALRSSDTPEVVEDVALDTGAEFMLVTSRLPEVSSTKVRELIHKTSPKYLEPNVLTYIIKNKLYIDKSSDKA